MRLSHFFATLSAASAFLAATGVALAQDAIEGLETVGKPVAKTYGYQPQVTELARDIVFLDDLLLWIIGVITGFVILLLLWVAARYNSRVNKTPATFTHHSLIEVLWTVVPIVILIFIGAFSVPILFKQLRVPEAYLTIKVTGNQWYWSYEYTDDNFSFDSFMLERDELESHGYAQDEYLLATDTAVVVPVNQNVTIQVTGSDVIHSWTIPAFGVKQDGVPGRLAELWFNADREGIYFGQCSELCGKDHSYMPITVKVVSQDVYDAWLKGAIEEYAGTPPAVTVASN